MRNQGVADAEEMNLKTRDRLPHRPLCQGKGYIVLISLTPEISTWRVLANITGELLRDIFFQKSHADPMLPALALFTQVELKKQ